MDNLFEDWIADQSLCPSFLTLENYIVIFLS